MARVSVRNRNEGKLYKDGRKKEPNWEFRFDCAKVDGKRKQICRSGFKTKGEAEKAGTKALAEYNHVGYHFDPSDLSVSDYFDYWLENYCKMNVADSTMTGYKNIINKHLKPRIGSYRLKAINTMLLQEQINDIYIHQGFTKSFMKNILKVLKGSFKYAKVTAKLIQTNPAEDISLPKTDISHNQKEEIIVLSKNDVNRILNRFQKSSYQYYAILTAYYTGLRVSEVYGLTWDCVDFDKGTLTVNKIVKKIEKNGRTSDGKAIRGVRGKAATRWYLGDCKTESSNRVISIGNTLLNALREYKKNQEENEALYGEFYTKHYVKEEITETHHKVKRIISIQEGFLTPLERIYPVFIKENGEFHGTDSIKYVSKVTNYELGIRFNFHALRHTHATMLIESGAQVKSVSERLGHSTTRTTLDTYVHVTDAMRNETVKIFEESGDLNV